MDLNSEAKLWQTIVRVILSYDHPPTLQDRAALEKFDPASSSVRRLLEDLEFRKDLGRELGYRDDRDFRNLSASLGVQSFAHFPVLYCFCPIQSLDKVRTLPGVRSMVTEAMGVGFQPRGRRRHAGQHRSHSPRAAVALTRCTQSAPHPGQRCQHSCLVNS